jgi:hypothetical protein
MVVEKALIVNGPTEFKGQVFFAAGAEFEDKANFKKEVSFDGTVTFNSDTAGFATIKKGERKVRISFNDSYEAVPVVQANIALWEDDSEEAEDLKEKIFEEDVKYLITNQSKEGFMIELKSDAPDDLRFSWTALATIEE